jgi:hypothetical protein
MKNKEHATRITAMKSVRATTFNQYSSHIHRVRRFCEEAATEPEITTETYMDYLAAMQHATNRNTQSVDTEYAAIRFYLACTGERGSEKRIEMLKNAAQRRQTPSNNGVRGAIMYKQVEQLLRLPDLPDEYRDAFVILAASGMRACQYKQLMLDEVRYCKGEDCWVLTVPRCGKGRSSATNKRSPVEEHVCHPYWNARIRVAKERAEKRVTVRNPNPVLAHRWKQPRALAYIKEAAKIFKWSPELEWVIHGQRHGAAAEAFLRYSKDGDAVKVFMEVYDRTHHVNLQMILDYAKTNEDRLFLARAQQAARTYQTAGLETMALKLFEGETLKRTRKELKVASKVDAKQRAAFKTMIEKETASAKKKATTAPSVRSKRTPLTVAKTAAHRAGKKVAKAPPPKKKQKNPSARNNNNNNKKAVRGELVKKKTNSKRLKKK